SVARGADGAPQYYIRVVEDVTETRMNEARYRAMFENAAVGITRVDLNGVLVDVNQKFCDMLGYARAELVGKAILDITHPDDYGQGATFRSQVTQGALQEAIGEKRFVRKDGAIIWGRRTMSVARDHAGHPRYVISVVEDITERKEAEAGRAQLAAIVQNSNDAIIGRSLDGTITSWNAGAERIFGYSGQEIIGQSITVLVPEGQGNTAETTEKLRRGDTVPARERVRIAKDGRAINVLSSISPIKNETGEVVGAAVIVRDISESKQAEERYRTTFDNAPVGIMHTSIEDDRILHANSKLCEMLGYAQGELARMHTDEFVHPDHVGADQPRYREAMLKGEVSTFSSERLYRRRDGSDLWVNRTVSLVKDAAGKPLYFIRVIEDIGERKQAEMALR